MHWQHGACHSKQASFVQLATQTLVNEDITADVMEGKLSAGNEPSGLLLMSDRGCTADLL